MAKRRAYKTVILEQLKELKERETSLMKQLAFVRVEISTTEKILGPYVIPKKAKSRVPITPVHSESLKKSPWATNS